MQKTKHNGGYVGLVALLVTVLLITFLIIKQYERVGVIKDKNYAPDIYYDNSGVNRTPIESAQNAKDVLEKKDRATFEY
jgi:hypothetical protein